MLEMITNSDINNLRNLNATFTALLHVQLTIYSTGDEKGLRKTDDLTQRFGFLHNGKQLAK